MANVETPERAPRSAQPPHTRSEEPESPINTDLRGNKRRQRAHTRAEPSIGSTAPTSYNQAVSEAVRQRIQAAQKATNLHHSIITDLATAVDRCLGKYTDPDGARVAKDLQQKVLRAINTSLITPLITPPNSGSDSDTTHRSWADVARTLKNPTPPARGAATTKAATAAPKQLAQTPRRPLNTDNRILIAVGAEARLQRASPFAARMAIVKAIKEITPSDIPTAKHIKTGWAITPRNDKIKALLMGQENRELMIRAVEGESARLPERWVNYAVQGVESSYRTITGETSDLVRNEGTTRKFTRRNHATPTQTNAERAWEADIDIVCIQEPFTLTGTRTSTHPGFHMISPVISWNNPTTWGTDRPRVLTYTRKSPNIRATLIHPRISRDVLWIEANGYRILNVYRQPQNDSTFQYLTALTPPRNCLIGGDLNARHELFEPGSTSANRGAEIARWATQNDIPYIGEAVIRGRAAGNRRIPRSKVQRVAQLLPATPRNVLASPHFSDGSRQDPTQGQGKDIAAQNFTIWWESLGQETITVFSDGSEQQINGTRVVTYGYAIYQGQAAVATGQGSLNALSHVFDAEAIGACRGLKHALQLSLPSQREIVLCIDSTAVIWGIRGTAPTSS
ncbi:Exo endo phos 2 domain containing protein [Pyrenophora tritici-repentis]|nr:Exo endo phos 2 domain containing protein [Pyrenophora tritici-repentis]